MDHAPSHQPIEIAAQTLQAIWGAMLRGFGLFGVEPVRQIATARWFGGKFLIFGELLARYRAGKLRRFALPRVVTPRVVAPGQDDVGRKLVEPPSLRMPRTFAWLVATGKHHAAGYGGQIHHVLSQPEMAELLEISPQARRILKPLLRALAVELPWTVDKPRSERGVVRRRRTRPKPEPPRIPWPRGVLTWARKEKALEKAIKLRDEMALKMA